MKDVGVVHEPCFIVWQSGSFWKVEPRDLDFMVYTVQYYPRPYEPHPT